MGAQLRPGDIFAGYWIDRLLGCRREANIIARLSHPNIVTIFAQGEEDGQLWLSMAYVDGSDLAAELRGGPVAPSRAADVYPLGYTLYEMLYGTPPYGEVDLPQLIYSHLHAPVPSPSAKNPALPAALDSVVVRAMAKNPRDRFATCLEFADALSAALAGLPAPPPNGYGGTTIALPPLPPQFPSDGDGAGRSRRGRRLLPALVIAILVASGIGVAERVALTRSDSATAAANLTVAGRTLITTIE